MNVISSYLGGVRHHENQVSCLRRLMGTMFLCRLESGPLLKTYVCSLMFVCLFNLCRAEGAEQCFNFTQKILSRYLQDIPYKLSVRTFKTSMMDATRFVLHCGSNISNKGGIVSSHFQSLRWQLDNVMQCSVFGQLWGVWKCDERQSGVFKTSSQLTLT